MAITLDGTNGILSPDFEPSGSTTPTNGLFLPTTNALGFATNSTERLRLDASGNLGLGVTPSTWNSAFRSIEIGNVGNSILGTGGSDIAVVSGAYFNAGWKFAATNSLGASNYEQYNGSHLWFIKAPAAHTAGDAISFTQAMTLDASGNLLVGTTSSLTASRLTAWSSTAVSAIEARVNAASSDSTSAISTIKNSTTNTTSQVHVQFTINGGATGAGQINSNGANAAAFGSFSDSRLKENITALPNQLANICALKPSEFDYKDGSGHQIGFIAQEMQEVYPDAIGEGEGEGEDGMLTITGWSKTEARLVKAIQELTARLEALEAK